MRKILNIAAVAVNTTPLDTDNNIELIYQAYSEAVKGGADVVLTPELAVTGYGMEDMFYVSEIMHEVPSLVVSLASRLRENTYLAVGFPYLVDGGQLYNAVALLTKDRVLGIVFKQHLARSGIHYEPRWFNPWQAGSRVELDFAGQKVPAGDIVIVVDGVRIGFEICEDSWVADRPGRSLYLRNTDIILNPSASHFAIGKQQERSHFIIEGSRTFGTVYVYANLLGCESGRAVYDGDCMIASGGRLVAVSERLSFTPYRILHASCDLRVNRNLRALSGMLLNVADAYSDGVVFTDCVFGPENDATPVSGAVYLAPENEEEAVTRTVALGLWDWMRKTHTGGFALSLSGGADSALCAAMVYYAMAEGLNANGYENFMKTMAGCGLRFEDKPENMSHEDYLRTVIMPKVLVTLYQGSQYSGDVTFNAAKGLACEIGASHNHWSIAELVKEYIRLADSLTPDKPMTWEKDDLALQNIQARVRSPGIWLLANRTNKLLIATSNLSEASVGYCTMDGDTSGVISPIGGISKSRVLKINRYIMEQGLSVQDNRLYAADRLRLASMSAIVAQAPTAELRPVEQTDESDLMPYPLLDEIRSLTQNGNLTPKEVFIELCRSRFAESMSRQSILNSVRRYYRLYTRNQWKRERIAASFHIERDSADPKTFRRFPILSSALSREMAALNAYASGLGLE